MKYKRMRKLRVRERKRAKKDLISINFIYFYVTLYYRENFFIEILSHCTLFFKNKFCVMISGAATVKRKKDVSTRCYAYSIFVKKFYRLLKIITAVLLLGKL